jgi:tetratricopeptide (TPR) repeat protein
MIERWQSGGSRGREAFDFYVRARRAGHKRTPDADDQAAELYQMAIDRDPKFALAYVGLAEGLLSSIGGREVPVDKVAARVRDYVERAEKISPDLPEIESTRGWLALESNELPEAVTHLKAAIARNPNDAITHSRLGIVYGLLAQPRDSLQAQTRAAELDPHDFIAPMYLCIQLQELGQFDEAARACARARELGPDSPWGPLVTSWLEDGRGDLPEAIRWTIAANKLEPSNANIVFWQIELLLGLHLIGPAREAASTLGTKDEARSRLIQASLALAENGQAGLKNYLANVSIESVNEPATRIDAVRAFHTAGDLMRARAVLKDLIDAPGFDTADLYRTDAIRSGFSPAIVAGGALLAVGERERAMKILDGLESQLDRLEANGWTTYGIDSLRAESRALQGDGDGAMRSLRRAVDRGWRGAWLAREEPYLASLRGRQDFQDLLRDVEARNASMRARYLEPTTPPVRRPAL